MDKTRMGKRVASLLLSLVMMLSLLPTAAYATMADGVETQGAIVSENGTGVSDDSNSSGNTDDLQVGGSKDSGTADDTTGAEGGADPTDSVNGNDSADPQDDGDAVLPVASSVVSTSEELVAAIAAANDGDTITLGEGEFTTYGNTSPKKSLTFVGAGTGTVWTIGNLSKDVKGEGNGDCSFDGCETITFQNMTLKSDGADYRGFIRISNTAVKKCTLVGKTAYWGYETAKFEDSTFNAPVGDYALWDYSTKAMTFEGCTFNISGKGVNVYVEQPSTDARTVEVNGCTVNSDKAGKAFLNIKNSTQAFDVTLSGTNTVTGLEANGTTGSALYQVETTEVTETTGKPVAVKAKADDGTVTTLYEVKETVEASVAEVNGAKYKSLQAAVDAAKSGATVTLLADTRENVTVSKNAIVLDLNGHTLNGGTENAKPALTVDNKKVTLKDSSEAQTGTIKREDTADTKTSHYVIDIQGKNGFMIVESGKVENNSGIPGVKGSSLIRLGNDSVSGWPTLTIKGGTFTQDNFIAIKVDRGTLHLLGGTVNSANSFAIENWNNAYIKGGTVNGTVSTWVYSTGAAFSKLEISGGTVNGNVASVNYDNAADKQARVYVTGGTVTGTLGTYTYNNGLVAMDETAKATIEVTGGTFSKDPTQYVVEDSAISKNDDGTYGVAKTYLAKIGDTEYYTMDEAFHAVKAGETIVMLRDYTTNKVQNSGDESFTIDLGGHTWTANIVDTASAAFEINYSDVTLTVKNGKVVSSQLAGLIPSAMSGTITYNNSELVFDGVEMTANGHSGIETNGSNTNDTVTLKNSTLNVPNGYGIYFPSSGTLTIDNSVINAKTMGVQVCSGSLNISGAGTAITVTGDGIAKTENDGAIEDGAAISIVERTGYKGLIAIKVESGTFTAKAGNDAVKAYKWDNTNKTESAFDNSKNVVAVSGGTFSSAVDKSLCADGFIPTKNEDGTYGVKEGQYVAEVGSTKYATLQAAIDAAARNATVTMLADTRENVTISTNYLTLDLNGHTLNGGTVKGKPALTVTARVTVKDSSAAKTGTIMREDTAENSGVSSHYVIDIQDGWLFFESGSVTNNSGVVGVKGASLVRVGDDSVAKYPGLTISGGTFTQDNFIVIKVDRGTFYLKEDGTLNSKNSYAVENWKFAEIKGGTVNGTVAAWTYSGGHNSDLTISGGTVNGNVLSVNYGSAEGKLAKVSITGGTVNGALDTRSYDPSTNELTSIDDATKATIAVTGGTFSEAPTKYVVEDSAITPNADGTYGVAKAYLAKVGNTSYYTMEEAFKAQTASGADIVLLRDYTTGSTFNSGSIARTVDLNGHTWTCTGTDANSAAFEINYSDASLTVKNGKVVSSQLVGLIPSAMGGTIKYDNSSLVFEGVEMTTTARSGIETNGNNTNDTVTLRNSTLNVPNGFGIYFPSSGTLTIDNSVINAETMGVQVCSGSLNVTGADTAITVSGDGIDKTINDGAIEDGAAISIVNRAGYKGLDKIKVEGGKFTAKGDNAAVKAYNWENQTASAFDNSKNVVAISGGTFSSAVDKSLCAEGYIPTQNADGTYGVKEGKFVAEVGSTKYETLAEAIAAAQEGQTVTLLADVADCGSLTISKNITLDGSGHTISGNSSISVNMPGNAAADVTIRNVNFKDIANGNKLSAFYFSQVKGKLTITGCTFDSIEYEAIQVTPMEGAEVNVSNNVFRAKADGTQVRHIHIEMAYGSGFDCEGQNIKLTVTDNQLHGTVSGDASMGIWWVGTDSTLKVDGNYVEHPETVSITLANGGVHYNRGDLIYPARSQADVDVDDLMPAVIVADKASGESKIKAYSTLAEAVAAAQDGQTVRLLADVEQNTQLTINKSITLDLNGKTIKNTEDIWGETANAILSITNGAKVTITGNGTIDAKENDCYTINVVKGNLTIENGTFYGNVSVVQVEEGTLSVKGGTFDLHQKWEGSSKYLFNCIDSEFTSGNAKVAISGGTFVGFDPNVSPEQKVDGKTPSFAAPGVGITKNENGSFTAVDGMTAQILDKDGNSVKAYNKLADAVAAAQDGQTVRLLADVTLDAQIATGKAITIDGQSKYTIKAAKLLVSADNKAGMFYRTQSANGTLTFLNVTLDGNGVSKIFLNEGGAGETVFDGVTSTNGGGIAYGSGIHISGGGSHATIRNSTLTGSTGTMELNNANYYAANDLWVGGNVYVTVENSVIGNVFVNSAPSATATNGVVHGQLTITGENTKITYLSGEEEAADKLDKFGNNGSLVKIDSGYVEKVFDKGSYAISGGTFKTKVEKEWCAAGYVPTQNGDGTYGVKVGMFTVMVTSRTTGSNSPVANVAGGGSNITYAQGTKVTASAISGYNFVGWFVNEYTGTPYSTDLTCAVKPTDDWTMIAVYEPISGGVFALEVSASKFTVNGGATQRSYLLEKMPIGTQVTVVFKGSENFLYWVNESGKVVSTSKTYTFSMGSATTLKAVYAEKEENQAMVVFISHTQQVISSKGYTDTQEIQFPEPPIKMGATFVRWSMTEAEIRAAMATTATGIIVVEPVYEFSAGSYTVTVNYPNDETATYTATVGKITTVTAKSIDGKVFKCWKNGDTVLGYTETLRIAPRGELTLTAEYVDAGTTVDRLPVIALTEISASQQGAKYAVSFTATRSVPDGYTVTEQGILVSTNSQYGEADALDAMKLDANGNRPDNTLILKDSNTDAMGVTVLNGTTKYADRTVYGRAYMILRDSSGTMVYVYSDTILSGSYNSLTTNGGN